MTPEAIERYLDGPVDGSFPGPPWKLSVRTELATMCALGAHAVRAGKYDALEFDLMNEAEATFVKAYMDERFPGVPYRRKWMDFEASA